jgi:hypothetical protein
MVSNAAVWGWGYSGYLVRPHANYVACEVLAQAGAVDGRLAYHTLHATQPKHGRMICSECTPHKPSSRSLFGRSVAQGIGPMDESKHCKCKRM